MSLRFTSREILRHHCKTLLNAIDRRLPPHPDPTAGRPQGCAPTMPTKGLVRFVHSRGAPLWSPCGGRPAVVALRWSPCPLALFHSHGHSPTKSCKGRVCVAWGGDPCGLTSTLIFTHLTLSSPDRRQIQHQYLKRHACINILL